MVNNVLKYFSKAFTGKRIYVRSPVPGHDNCIDIKVTYPSPVPSPNEQLEVFLLL